MARAKTSDLLKQVISGATTDIEGVKLSKNIAQKLLNLYNSKLIDQSTFDQSSISKITSMLHNLGLNAKLENASPSKKLTLEQKNKIKNILRENI